MANKEIKYEIVERIGVLGEPENGKWGKELNLIKWGNARNAKFDLRSWKREDWNNPNPETDIAGKGITLNDDEVGFLLELLSEHY